MGEEGIEKGQSSNGGSNVPLHQVSFQVSTGLQDNKNNDDSQSSFKTRQFATVVATVKKGQGVRQRRRLENSSQFLLNLVENEEYSNEESFSEFVSSSSGSFEKLFSDKESMEIWNKFINKSGEEQEQYLENLEEYEEVSGTLAKVEMEQRVKENDDEEGDEVVVDDQDFLIVGEEDKREAFPAYTSRDCYTRISSRLRAFLKRRQIPQASLEYHEDQLVTWFSEDPQSVWITHLPNNYERLLLHAVSQYLDLNSASYNCDGLRYTKVENKNDYFHSPLMCLSDYLQSVR